MIKDELHYLFKMVEMTFQGVKVDRGQYVFIYFVIYCLGKTSHSCHHYVPHDRLIKSLILVPRGYFYT